MRRTIVAALLGLFPFVGLVACGETSGAVLEHIPEEELTDSGVSWPRTQLRVDAFVVRNISTCAIGESCNRNLDPDGRGDGDCFELDLGDGTHLSFRGDSLDFVAMDDPRYEQAPQKKCFTLGIDDHEMEEIDLNFGEEGRLFNRVYELSGEEIVLDVRLHEVGATFPSFPRFENEWTLFLPADALDGAEEEMSRDTDFTFAITGFRDEANGVTPRSEHCAGTIRDLEEGLGGAPYTWLSTECNGVNTLIRHLMFQIALALRDANRFDDVFDRNYPSCGATLENPSRWWPNPDECRVDPDSPTCGDQHCEGTDEDYVRHVLTEHWTRGRDFVGNHCDNGRLDFDETDADLGGTCAALGR